MRTSMRKLKPLSRMRLPSKPRRSAARIAFSRRLAAIGILATHVDVSLLRTNCIAGDGHAFKHSMRVRFHECAVHVSARVTFIAIGDHVFTVTRRFAHEIPFDPGRIACAPAPAQPAPSHGFADFFGCQLPQSMRQRRITALRHVGLRGVPGQSGRCWPAPLFSVS